MKDKFFAFIFLASILLLVGWAVSGSGWIVEKYKSYTLYFQQQDADNKSEYIKIIDSGMQLVKTFFGEPYKNNFTIVVHPDRASLDSSWQKDWNMPSFKSECWMIASGVAARMDIIAPVKWDLQSCEHRYTEKEKTLQLITHELFHVFHGQFNASPDFSNTDNIDWFVEGLATFASGQCDQSKLVTIKKMIADHKVPSSLAKFWMGPTKYGLSGSVVLYIDQTYGRKKLKELLQFNTLSQLLESLGTTEEVLITNWKSFIEHIN